MSVVRIYKPSKTAMQSGRRKTHRWVLEFEPDLPEIPDPLMGWMGSSDTRRQLRLQFATCEEAVAYAEGNGLRYRLRYPHRPLIRPKSYAENFSANKVV